jgi:sulfate-transporting ATPase
MRLLLLGLVSGSIFSLSAVALVLVYRATGILNFAQGAVGMVGTFTFVSTASRFPIPVAILLGMLLAGAIGFVLALMTMPLKERRLEATVLTLAALALMQAGAQLAFGGHPVAMSRLFPTGAVRILGATVGGDELAAATIALLICGAVVAAMRLTRMGLIARAVASRPQVVAALGVDERPIVMGSWVIAGMLAALAGILLLTLQPSPDTASMTLLVIDSFAAALFGKLFSLPGAIVGGLVIGVVEVSVSQWINVPGAGEAAMFVAMIALLSAYPPARIRSASGQRAI